MGGLGCKFRKGHRMPTHGLKDAKVTEMRELVYRWGKLLAGEAYGPQGPGLEVDLAGMEELATIAQQALLAGLCEELTQRQAERLPGTLPCPGCGSECEVKSADEAPPAESGAEADTGKTEKKQEPRPMRLRGGTFALKEPRCFCRSCRRSFFPSADGVAD